MDSINPLALVGLLGTIAAVSLSKGFNWSTLNVSLGTTNLALFAAFVPAFIVTRVYVPYFLETDARRIRDLAGSTTVSSFAEVAPSSRQS